MIDWARRKWALYWLLRDDRISARITRDLRLRLSDADSWLGRDHYAAS